MKKIEGKASAPTDLELMLYFDGELDDEARSSQIEAFLAREQAATSKLRGMKVVGDVVRDRAIDGASLGAGIADSVMAAIEAEATKPAKPAVVVAEKPNTASVARPKLERVAAPAEAPKNDNSRTIYSLAALALAAAAAFAIWGRGETTGPTAGLHPSPVDTPSTVVAPSPPSPVAPEGPSHGVEVASVDFGENNGTIIYGADEATTVVWVQSSATEGL